MLKVRLLKFLDRLVGAAAVRILPKPVPGAVGEPRRILFVRPGGIGDAVLLIPAIRAVRKRYPRCQVTVLAEKRNAAVFSLCGDVGFTLRYDSARELASAVRGAYDVVVDTEQWHRLSAVIARLVGAPVSTGFATNGRARMFTHQVPYSHDDYEAESFFSLLAPLAVQGNDRLPVPFLDVPEAAAVVAERKLATLAGKPFVCIFPGASIPERRWGTEKFRELARRLNQSGYPVVALGGGGDSEAGEGIAAGGAGLNLAGKTTLAETAAVLARSLLLVTGDSGLLHLAVGLGVPTVSLFGPGIEKKWAPREGGHTVQNLRLPCSPCTRFGYTPRCPIGARCLADIGVDEVEKAAKRLLENIPAGKFHRAEQIP